MLGSIGVITDENATVVSRMHFDPWGQRVDATDWDGAPSATDIASTRNITHRGFTGHEQLDAVNLVHMNGRVYDPNLGRMLSADPINSDPANLQRHNRYSYVNNRPLNFTDPSGFDEEEPARLERYYANGSRWDLIRAEEFVHMLQMEGNRRIAGAIADGVGEFSGTFSDGTPWTAHIEDLPPDDPDIDTDALKDSMQVELERNRAHLNAVAYIQARTGPTMVPIANIAGFGEPQVFQFVGGLTALVLSQSSASISYGGSYESMAAAASREIPVASAGTRGIPVRYGGAVAGGVLSVFAGVNETMTWQNGQQNGFQYGVNMTFVGIGAFGSWPGATISMSYFMGKDVVIPGVVSTFEDLTSPEFSQEAVRFFSNYP